MQLLKTDAASLPEGKKGQRRGSMGRLRVLEMDNFIDTTNIEGRFEMSEYVRAYGKYLDEQLEVFAAIRFYQVRPILRVVASFCACILSSRCCKPHSKLLRSYQGTSLARNVCIRAWSVPHRMTMHVGCGMRLLFSCCFGFFLCSGAGWGGRQ